MSKLTTQDALDLSKELVSMANEIGSLRLAKWSTSTSAEDRILADQQWDLLTMATRLETDAVGAILDTAQTSINKIKSSIKAAKNAVKTIQTIKSAVKIASAVVVLAGAIATQNPGAIGGAVVALGNVIANP
ncbi:MAG: hypothetical protein SFU85_02920 [Candidatus Methylacidiphilales bacterium]|nr:hypothetical protein [Candidatus Methylacidiphilales bacterium]